MMEYHSAGTLRAGLPCQPPWAALQAGCASCPSVILASGGLISH